VAALEASGGDITMLTYQSIASERMIDVDGWFSTSLSSMAINSRLRRPALHHRGLPWQSGDSGAVRSCRRPDTRRL